ncbi:acyltransferase family-domain-containing protein [Protomyces lactucae-debilis]|uniref:Acyltransferase family-domain-containing protein n=1 Tax=Protomyces lactucae-debilis TaxID=2754530 RepID=A0A1Y2FH33_PROLT|nr:acyltransferase family-domain-containing protein [Protomyces lactucae-debilis]ORY83239.1 acyltransferase family-domain-containing protein [Protomyces lactucae-debilis]
MTGKAPGDIEMAGLDIRAIDHQKPILRTPNRTTRAAIRHFFCYPEPHLKIRPTAWLDGLRGAAAFEVLVYHYHLKFLGQDYNPAYGSRVDTRQWWRLPFIRNIFHSGHSMVNVFFIISGLVLTQRSLSLIRTKQHAKLYPAISSAMFRRGIRIYLPAVIVSFFGMLTIAFGIRHDQHIEQPSFLGQVWHWMIACRDFANPWHDYDHAYDLVHKYEHTMWTLPLEFYGSLVCWVTLLTVSRIADTRKRTAVVLMLCYFSFVKGNWWSLNFLWGILLADFLLYQEAEAASQPTGRLRLAIKAVWFALLIWCLYVCGLPDAHYADYSLPGFDWYYHHVPQSFRFIEEGGRFWWMISGSLLVVCISQLPPVKLLFECRPLQYLGKISFMMYLVHTYVLELVGVHFKDFVSSLVSTPLDVPSLDGKGTITFMVPQGRAANYFVYFAFWSFNLPLVFAVSGWVTRYVDDPSIRFAKWLEGQFVDDA